MENKVYHLLNANRESVPSNQKGLFGGNKELRIYGKLDCSSANSAVTKGTYQNKRVFFKDEEAAIAAGYRPCCKCLKDKYTKWKEEIIQKHGIEHFKKLQKQRYQ